MKVKKPIKFLLLAIVTIFAWRTVVCFDFLVSFSYFVPLLNRNREKRVFPLCIARILLWNCFASAMCRRNAYMCVCKFVHSTLAFAFWSLRLEFKFICLPRAQMCVLCASKFSFSYQCDDSFVTMHCTHTRTRACQTKKFVLFFHFFCCYLQATCLNAKPIASYSLWLKLCFRFAYFCVDIRWFCQYIEHFTR